MRKIFRVLVLVLVGAVKLRIDDINVALENAKLLNRVWGQSVHDTRQISSSTQDSDQAFVQELSCWQTYESQIHRCTNDRTKFIF